MKGTRYVIIALMSMTLIALEMVWTRIFSAEFFYTFAFLILSLAILGLGLGALALRLLPFLNRNGTIGWSLSLGGLMALIGSPLVVASGLDFTVMFSSLAMIAKLVLVVAILSSSFFFGGIALALLFKQNIKEIPSMYMADLLGAGIGVMVVIALMNGIGTPSASFLVALPAFCMLKKLRHRIFIMNRIIIWPVDNQFVFGDILILMTLCMISGALSFSCDIPRILHPVGTNYYAGTGTGPTALLRF